MESLPLEIIEKILNFVPNRMDISLVCKKWHQATFNSNHIQLKVNQTVWDIGLSNILNQFKSLLSMDFQYGAHCSPYLLHRVALSFAGSKTIKSIKSISDYIIYGAIKCPRLEVLQIPFHQAGVRHILVVEPHYYPDFDILKHRDIGFILNHIPRLKALQLDSPTWLFSVALGFHNLESLHLTSVDGVTINSMENAFRGGFVLPYLKSIKLDLDQRVLPSSVLQAFSIACPSIKTIKISYATFDPLFIPALSRAFPKLESLGLTRCAVHFPAQSSWRDRILQLAALFPCLERLSLRYLELLNGGSFEVNLHDVHHLKVLKIFQIEGQKSTWEDLKDILPRLPLLDTLRLDLESNKFSPTPVLNNWMTNITNLELRYGKTLAPISNHLPIQPSSFVLPKLKRLAVWGYMSFPDELIAPNEKQIEYLDLKYAMWPPQKKKYSLPRLKSLVIRTITPKAQQICVDTLSSLIQDASLLQIVDLCAINNNSSSFELGPDLLHLLGTTCPRLSSLKTLNFTLPNHSLALLSKYWPRLQELSVKGNMAIETITKDLEQQYLFPIVRNHPLLSFLSLTVAGIDVPIQDMSTDYHQYAHLQLDRYRTFREYEERLTESFPHCRFNIRAPILDYYQFNR